MKMYSYNMKSASAKALAEALGIKRIKHEGGVVKSDIVLNWGCSVIERDIKTPAFINKPAKVAIAANKLSAFKAMSGKVSIPEFTESREEAARWLLEGVTVVARKVLNGHSGNGIVIYKGDGEKVLDEAPLYVKYIPKRGEYRIHVNAGEVFFVQRKARKEDVPDDKVNWQVRNHANGFIYANREVYVSEEAQQQAIMAVDALGLDFGAVDVINGVDRKVYILEINTAPGLQGASVQKYVEQFKEFV